MSSSRFFSIALAAVMAAPVSLHAQRAGNPPLGFVTTPYSFELSDGEPISWFLEYSYELKLTPEQRRTLIDIRRKLRYENERHVERMDSVARSVGLVLGERIRMDADDRQALERFNEMTRPTRDSLKVNNDLARAEALTLLTAPQKVRLDSLMAELQRERGRGPLRRPRGGAGPG